MGQSSGKVIEPMHFIPNSLGAERNLALDVKEFDKEEREATVYLFTRPVEGRSDEDDSKRHWALVFIFEDSTVRYVEGNKHEGLLMPFYFKERPQKEGKYIELGEITTSPKILQEIAVKKVPSYNLYHFAKENCQDWVKKFARAIGDFGILKKLNGFLSFREAYPTLANMILAFSSSSNSSSGN